MRNRGGTPARETLIPRIRWWSRSRSTVVGLLITLCLGLVAVLAPILSPFDPIEQDLYAVNQPPSRTHWLGTDQLGRDTLSRIIWGARFSLSVSLSAVALGGAIGLILGVCAGYFRGVVDGVVMRVVDVLFAFPMYMVAIFIMAVLEPSSANTVIIHCYGENLLFTPDMTEIRSVVERGLIGRPLWMRGREGHFGPHSPWFYQKELSGGGALLDMGCHLIGAFNLLGKRRAEAVLAHTPTLHHDTDCEDNALAIVRYEGGLVGQAEASWTQRGGMAVAFEVWGDEGMITYDRSGLSQPIKVFTRRQTDRYFSEKVEHRQGWLFPTVQEYWRYGYYDQIRHFVECLRGEAAPLLTFEDGLAVNRIIDAAYASGRSGAWESLT